MKISFKRMIYLLLVAALLLPTFGMTACKKDDPKDDEPALTVSKPLYATGEEIVVTANGDDDDWVGIYREKDDVGAVDPIARYSVHSNGYLSGLSYIVQRSAKFSDSRKAFWNFPAVKYKVVLFGSEGTKNVLSTVHFEVSSDALKAPVAPAQMTYTQSRPGTGLADGELKVEFDPNTFNASELVLYWADDNGPLSDWTALATAKVSSNPFVYRFVTGTIIPPGATALWAYAKNKLGTSETHCTVKLPEGAAYRLTGEILSRFQVVSDIHIAIADTHLASSDAKELHAAHLLMMARDIVSVCPDSQALIAVGDIANSGRDYEWQKAADILASVSGLPPIYYAIGNHDLYLGSYNTQIGYFYKYAGVRSVYYEKEIGGFHHIFLGSESNNKSGVDADLSDAQLNWLEERLRALRTEDRDKPVFVYLHQSLYNTVSGSLKGQNWNGVMQEERLRSILQNYPQVYLFNGHSHWHMNSYGNHHAPSDDGLPNIFNTASVGYLWSSDDNPDGEYLRGSQGYYVWVYSGKVLVFGRDYETGKYIPSACYEATNGN